MTRMKNTHLLIRVSFFHGWMWKDMANVLQPFFSIMLTILLSMAIAELYAIVITGPKLEELRVFELDPLMDYEEAKALAILKVFEAQTKCFACDVTTDLAL